MKPEDRPEPTERKPRPPGAQSSAASESPETGDRSESLSSESEDETILFGRAHVGPLPSPEALADYDRVSPGLTQRIVEMAVTEQRHRHQIVEASSRLEARALEIEVERLRGALEERRRGQWMGLGITSFALVVAAYAALHGAGTFASVLAGTTIGALAAVFVLGRMIPPSAEKPSPRESSPEGQGDAA